MSTERSPSFTAEPAYLLALRQEFHALQKALHVESARAAPDFAVVRGLRAASAGVRAKIAAATDEPPPHTD
jgi:hypothetical protein